MYGRFAKARAQANAALANAPQAQPAQSAVSYRDHLIALGDLRREYEEKLKEKKPKKAGDSKALEAALARVSELEAEKAALEEKLALLEGELRAATELLEADSRPPEAAGEAEKAAVSEDAQADSKPASSKKSK